MAAPVYQRAFSQDINEPVFVRHCGGLMFTGDALSDTISVEMYDEDAPYSMSGTVVCNCIRADGATVPVSGSVSGNKAQATLVANCFAIPGPLAVVMQITSGSTTTTLLKAVYTVDISATGTTIDPGNVITDVNALIAAIETAVAAIPADYTGFVNEVRAELNSASWLRAVESGYIIGSDGKWTLASSKHVSLPVKPGDTVRLTGGERNGVYALLKTDNAASGVAADFSTATGYTARIVLDAQSDSGNITIPSDTNFLYIATYAGGNDIVPASILINGVEMTYGIRSRIDSLTLDANSANRLREEVNGSDGLKAFDEPYIIGDQNVWAIPAGRHVALEVSPGDIINITAGAATIYAMLKTKSYAASAPPDFSAASGFTARILLNADTDTGDVTVPTDTHWLYLASQNGSGDNILPVSVRINGVERAYNVRARIDAMGQRDAWIPRVMASLPTNKVIHFSIDDVTFLSGLLASPAPSSIWSISEMAAIKTVHDNTGACFTLNLFVEATGYDISDIPATWASEFQAAKSWLRFAFHAKDASTNYADAATGAADYAKFASSVHTFTGTYDCIDRVPRLANYAGTLAQCNAMRALSYGPVGFLTADDSRLSYYFTQAQTDFVNAHGRLYDAENQFVFIPSLPRLDAGTSAQDGIDAVAARKTRADLFIEVFCHQTSTSSATITRLNKYADVATYATGNGFTNGFAMDYLPC